MSQSFRDLQVWQRSMQLAIAVYRLTRESPREEIYGLTSQMRRSAVSVPSNIAEGQGRLNPSEFRQFLGIARGSLCELQTQLEIARSLRLESPSYLTGRRICRTKSER
ncbi:MAG: four helix bundle protein [Terracidiphilus sp.]